MLEKATIKRELAKQTALLFVVFALVFSLLGAGVYQMVSANIFRTVDEDLEASAPSADIELFADGAEDASGMDAPAADLALSSEADEAGSAGDSPQLEALAADLLADIPLYITLLRDENGTITDTVGLYATRPEYLNTVPFNAAETNRIVQFAAGSHTFRSITYALEGETSKAAYAQMLVSVDSELAILNQFTKALVIYLAVAVMLSAAASYLLSRRTLRPLVESWRAQTEFVQNASHELRTPLAVIQTTADGLLDCPQSRIVDRFEDVSTVSEETKRLTRLVDGLMELSLDDAGHARLHCARVQVDDVAAQTTARYEDFAELQGKKLAVDARFGGSVEADEDKLRQVLGILLDNALKYTESGDSVTVSTRGQGTKCAITVADTGCGIAPEDRERAFERFYRADKARSRETGGHGLGLSLARAIVEAHGGTIALEANEPRGTVAVITLPR